MRKILFALCCSFLLLDAAELPVQIEPRLPRKIQIGAKPELKLIENGKVNFEIVIPEKANPSVKLAANEAAEQLSVLAGTTLKPVTKRTPGKAALILGDQELAAKLGIDLNKFDRDGFVIRTVQDGVLIIGRDDPKQDPRRVNLSEHATLFGTYDFLERFAGIRYYFPGKIGTVIPKKRDWAIPAISIYDRPDLYQRRFNDYSGNAIPIIRYEGADWRKNGNLNRFRNRYETFYIPVCHGLRHLGYRVRFGKTHPEYFALRSNGTRVIDRDEKCDRSHLCFSSPIKQEITLDAISFLKGEPASVRGVLDSKDQVGWMKRIFQPGSKFFNISPNDGVVPCQCKECQKYLSKGPQEVSNFMWQFYSDVANAVKKAGVSGYLTVPVYGSWRMIPQLDLPENLLVEMAIRGPWNELSPVPREKDLELLKAWCRKLGHKVWLWTYPGKYGGAFPGIPHTTPRYAASFLKRVRPYIFGNYFECEADYLIFNYLNHHIYGKIMWNLDTDVEKLLDEHVKIMYGPAAKPMKEYFDSIERNWMKIAGNAVNTPLGPVTVYPSDLVVWSKIYSPAEIRRLNGLFDEAEKLAAKSPEYLERVKFLRKEMWQPTLKAAENYCDLSKAAEKWSVVMPEAKTAPVIDGKLDDPAWKQTGAFFLTPLKGTPATVKTSVRVLCDKENFYFGFSCEDPGNVKSWNRPFDSQEIWRDAGIEVFLSPDKNPERFYQLMVNASGSFADLKKQGVNDWSWNSGAEVKSVITPGKGWVTEIRLPRKSMEPALKSGMRANFTRRYVPEKGRPQSCCWGPFVRDNPDLQRFGTVLFEEPKAKNLIHDGDFAPQAKKRFLKEWWTNNPAFLRDETYFCSAGASAKLEGPQFSIFQDIPLKPDTEYLLRFCLKMEKVKPQEPRWSGFYVRIDDFSSHEQYFPPMRRVAAFSGTTPWKQMEFRFRTSKTDLRKHHPRISFTLRKAAGTVWIDNVELFEQK